jgi:hypothetical protein
MAILTFFQWDASMMVQGERCLPPTSRMLSNNRSLDGAVINIVYTVLSHAVSLENAYYYLLLAYYLT